MITSFCFTQSNRYNKILTLIASPSSYLIGFGQYDPWTLDYSPPVPDPTVTDISEPIGFIPVQSIFGVAPTTSGGLFTVGGVNYQQLSPTLSALQANLCSLVCFQGTLYHSDVPQQSWREIALYSTATAQTAEFINAPLAGTALIGYENMSPTTRQPGAVEIIRLVLSIKGGL